MYGDGVITPAISVLSAIEGLKFSPAAANFVVPATLVILVGLFALQYRGTGSVGRLFGPVMVVWFVAIGVLGAINIWYAPEILAALNPMAAVRFAIESPFTLFIVLGGVFLALTGGEALYADMGHVGSRAIRQAWFGLVFPALILSYFGQGARVLIDPKAIANPFPLRRFQRVVGRIRQIGERADVEGARAIVLEGAERRMFAEYLRGLRHRRRLTRVRGDEPPRSPATSPAWPRRAAEERAAGARCAARNW